VSKRIVVVCEARADFEQATELADRVLVATVDWLEGGIWLDSNRQWIGDDLGGVYLTWKSIPNRARELGISVRGHFEGEPGQPDAQAARRAIAYVRRQFEGVAAVLLIRDMDDQPERRQGLEQARTHHSAYVRIVIGVANPERECWVLSGFDPEDGTETARLDAEKQKLGFDPCSRSHELTACKDDQAKRSAKRVLSILTADDRERERRCWRTTSLEVLEQRGGLNGLAEYLKEVKDRLVPLITTPAGDEVES
jgi:hypothetical protein